MLCGTNITRKACVPRGKRGVLPDVDFPSHLAKVIYYPLVTLSGTPVTLAAILIALFIFLAFRAIAQVVAFAIREGLKRHGQADGVAAAIAQITRYILVFLGLAIALNTIGVNVNALIAGSAGLLVGIGLGLQNVTSNVVSGIIVLIERPVKKGDVIQVGDVSGTVIDIGLRATQILTRDEVTMLIPNMELIAGRVINQSVPSPRIRMRVRVGVAYESDVDLVRETLLEVANEHASVLEEPEPSVRLEGFGESSLDFALLCWVPEAPMDEEVASDLRFAIFAAFRERGIGIPFPKRDVRIVPDKPAATEKPKLEAPSSTESA